ncbi:helix-turn-helix transcriptional regulator [Streptomyces blastmyceticus]|uniref:Transcriptional regulator WhiJ n=1 Tax=Streptomyces blastmyceticus TaxID=68180 RepID=A0ABP3HNJ2_9ACTN
MPSRSHPTQRQRRLGIELRKLREAAGMSAPEAGAAVNIKAYQVSHLEAGRVGVTPNRLRTLARNYGCADEALIDALVTMSDERDKEWWEEYRGVLPDFFLDIAEIEWHAKRLRNALTSHIPGLLQTEDHARAIFDMVIPELPAEQVDARVAHRLQRCGVLDRKDPPAYDAIIHESALRMQFGGRDVARAQLKHLLDFGERDLVSLRVIPFEAGGFPGAGQTVLYACATVPPLDTVQLDTSYGSVFVDSEEQLANYRRLFSKMELCALDERESRQFIHSIAQQI